MIKLASYVEVSSRQVQGFGTRTEWTVKVVTPDYTFYPMEGIGYSSPYDRTEAQARKFGQKVADALELDLQVVA